MKRPKQEINGVWKKQCQVLVVILLNILMTACTHAPPRKEIEVWLIDEKELVLYRKVSTGAEQAIPIKGNKDMRKFLVIDKDEVYDLIEEDIERRD